MFPRVSLRTAHRVAGDRPVSAEPGRGLMVLHPYFSRNCQLDFRAIVTWASPICLLTDDALRVGGGQPNPQPGVLPENAR